MIKYSISIEIEPDLENRDDPLTLIKIELND
jgi:hypothetical protein